MFRSRADTPSSLLEDLKEVLCKIFVWREEECASLLGSRVLVQPRFGKWVEKTLKPVAVKARTLEPQCLRCNPGA